VISTMSGGSNDSGAMEEPGIKHFYDDTSNDKVGGPTYFTQENKAPTQRQ